MYTERKAIYRSRSSIQGHGQLESAIYPWVVLVFHMTARTCDFYQITGLKNRNAAQ
jgi:hypothetical protein